MKKARKIIGVLAVMLLILWVAAGYVAVHMMCFRAEKGPFSDPSEFGGFPVEPVTLATKDGVTISAWHINAGGDRAVALFHGIDANRQQMGEVAKCYLEKDYSVLMADLRRHGKSGYAPTKLGLAERHDVGACMDFLYGKYERVGAHGFSLGAAAIAFAQRDSNKFSFLVFSSCYDTAEHALYNRLDLAGVPHWLALPFIRIAEWRLTLDIKGLNPLDCMPYAKAPALFISGEDERLLKPVETVDLYNHCVAPGKQIRMFKGGHHEPFAGASKEEFRSVLSAFLEGVK